MPLQSKIGGLRRVAVGILKSGKAALVSSPISNRDIAAGGYPVISGWGKSDPPLLIPKEESRIYSPENRGYVCPGSNLLPENSGYWPGGSALQGYISNRTLKGRNSLFSGSALFM